jgi:hypothetical protein
MNTTSQFSEQLRKHFIVVDQRNDQDGLRLVYVSGLRIEELDNEEFFAATKVQLPADARVLSCLGNILHFDTRQFRDRCAMVFISSEWESLAEGTQIPELRLLFAEDRDEEGKRKGIVPLYRLDAESTGYEMVYSYDRNRFRLEPVPDKCTEGREAFKLVLKK